MSRFCRHAALFSRLLLQNTPSQQLTVNRNIKRWVSPTLKELMRRRESVGPEPLQPRSTFLEWNYEAEIFAFGKRLGEDFDSNLLKQALTHKTYLNQLEEASKEKNEPFSASPDNREMISEGDSIINEYLRNKFSKVYENQDMMQAVCNYLTSEDMLAHVAKHLGLTDIILTSEFPVEDATLAETFKAVIAALNQSQNLERCHTFFDDFLVSQLTGKEIYDIWSPEKPYDYITKLLNGKDIEPRLCNQSAVNTILANYQIGLYSNKKLLGIGWGESVEIAKDSAALDAIQRFYNKEKTN